MCFPLLCVVTFVFVKTVYCLFYFVLSSNSLELGKVKSGAFPGLKFTGISFFVVLILNTSIHTRNNKTNYVSNKAC